MEKLTVLGCGVVIGASAVIIHRSWGRFSSPKESVKQRSEDISKLLLLVSNSQAESEGYVHRGVTCDQCKVYPIRGKRFKCLNCSNYDVCEACEPQDRHNSVHVFMQIKVPIPALVSPRTAICSSFYPGTLSVALRPLADTEIQALKSRSHFDSFEIRALWEQFGRLCVPSVSDGSHVHIDRDCYSKCLGPLGLIPNLVCDRIYDFFDDDQDGVIGFLDFVHGMSILCKGSQEEKITSAFRGFDLEKTNLLTRESFRLVFEAYFSLSIHQIQDTVRHLGEDMASNFHEEAGRPISAMFTTPIPSYSERRKRNKSNTTMIENEKRELSESMFHDSIVELVNSSFTAADKNNDNRICLEEFKAWAAFDPTIISWFGALGTVF